MRLRKILKAFFLLTLPTGIAWQLCNQAKFYKGPFEWRKADITAETQSLTSASVFNSITEFEEIYLLRPGDECYRLENDEFVWRDPKDMTPFSPILCPGKVAGWAINPGK